jgi:hypothetical protein
MESDPNCGYCGGTGKDIEEATACPYCHSESQEPPPEEQSNQ